jgi:hypothetical protein
MPPRFPAEILAKYPHMAPLDVPVWEKFLIQHGPEFTGFDYDVRVGKGITPAADLPEPYRSDAIMLSQKRIDVVGYRPSGIWIIEVKPQASIAALGQVLTYTELFIATRRHDLPVTPIVVCESIDTDMAEIFKSKAIQLVLV